MPSELPKFIFFKTACGCTKMERATPGWRPPPTIQFALMFPTAVHDWVNPPTDDAYLPTVSRRSFRLRDEEVISAGAVIYTYEETM